MQMHSWTHTELISLTRNGWTLVLSGPFMFLVVLSTLPYSMHSPKLPDDHFMPFSLSPQIFLTLLSISPKKQKQTRRNFSHAPTTMHSWPTCFYAFVLCLPSCYYVRSVGGGGCFFFFKREREKEGVRETLICWPTTLVYQGSALTNWVSYPARANYLCSLRSTPHLWSRFHSFLPPQGHYTGNFPPLCWITPSVYRQTDT